MRFKIKDEDGTCAFVESQPAESHDAGATPENPIALSDAELKTLKKLLKFAPQLFELFDGHKSENFEEDELGGADDEDDDKKKDKKADTKAGDEQVIETKDCGEGCGAGENDVTAHDSRASFGSVENAKTRTVHDSEVDRETEIAQAWANRYNNGGKN